MKIYTKASSEVHDRAAHLLKLFHPDCQKIGLRIDIIFVSSDDDEEEHPLMHQGYPAQAVISVVATKRRALGGGDVEIQVDEANYLSLTDAQKDALIDHELYHVELVTTRKGKVKLDCCKRPKVTMRKHDRQYGWFDEIAKRHGAASLECQQAQALVLSGKQIYFGFMDAVPKLKK
jgi:hypothetical protein